MKMPNTAVLILQILVPLSSQYRDRKDIILKQCYLILNHFLILTPDSAAYVCIVAIIETNKVTHAMPNKQVVVAT